MTTADGLDAFTDRRRRSWRVAALSAILAAVLVSCCPAPLGVAGTPTAFAATVTEIDAAGFWIEAADGTRWRVTGASPVQAGERVYAEGTFTAAGAFEAERTTRIGTD